MAVIKIRRAVDDYKRVFDESNTYWYTPKASGMYNLYFLKMHQNYFNDRLQSKGHVFFNEVLDALGFDRTGVGAVSGWVKGEGTIDFGFSSLTKSKVVNSDPIVLTFNVQGFIVDKL